MWGENMSKDKTTEEKAKTLTCWRCGRIIWENTKTGHTGCLNTKCKGYLWGAKNLDKEYLKQVKKQ